MASLFYNCGKLKNINLANIITENEQYFTSMFNGCSSMTSLNINNLYTTNESYVLFL